MSVMFVMSVVVVSNVVCAFVSMAAGNMSSRKHVCRCMFACTKGEVLNGRSG